MSADADRGQPLKVLSLGEAEHFFDPLFVAVAEEVVKGAAEAGLEGFRFGIGQIQGNDGCDDFLQAGVDRCLVEEGIAWMISVQEGFHPSGVNAGVKGVHGHPLPFLQFSSRLPCVHQGGNAEFPGQDRHVSGGAAYIGDDGRGFVHDGNEA